MKPPCFSACSSSAAAIVGLTLSCLGIAGCSGGATATPAAPITATPVFTPAAGSYTSPQSVTIADATAGATIYYTTDGSAPTTASKTYTPSISISATTTVQAIATAPGSTASSVASALYTILPAAPTASPKAGTYTSVQSVTLSDATGGASIYYTTDGSAPSPSSTLYSGPITVSTTETINAIASLNGQVSPVTSIPYVINLPASLSAYSGSNQNVQVGSGFAAPFQVQVLNSNSKPVTGSVVSFSAPVTGPGLTLSSSSCTTDSNGLCSVSARTNASVGTYTVFASIGSLTAAFTLTNTGLHSYVVTVADDSTAGVASNCVDQATSPGSANSNCSLRDALAAATTSASSTQTASVTFAQTTATTITLAKGPLVLPSYTTIQGATSGGGATLTNLITLDGNNLTSIFTQAGGVTQTAINNLTMSHGFATPFGGAISMYGSLTVSNSTFIGNQAASSGGAINNIGGVLTIFGSTFVNNVSTAAGTNGGGISNSNGGTVIVSDSTFTQNQASKGGAIYSSGTATITESTISGNTASSGAGVYNFGTMTVTNSIVNGNTTDDCGGIYCNPLWAYVLFSSATPSPVDSSSITIAFTDSAKNVFSQTVSYGPFSSPASIASTFGPYFYYNYSGVDTTNITGQSFGNLFVLSPQNGATLSPLTITNPGKSFTATQVINPSLLSANHNVFGVTAAQINLSALGNNGGPTQTMVPMSGSAALCVITPSIATGTDQRGQPRTVTINATACQDAGAVQTNQ